MAALAAAESLSAIVHLQSVLVRDFRETRCERIDACRWAETIRIRLHFLRHFPDETTSTLLTIALRTAPDRPRMGKPGRRSDLRSIYAFVEIMIK